MKIEATSSAANAAAARRAGGVAAPGFALPAEVAASAQQTARTAPATALASVGALLALQAEDGPEERRRRATRRADTLLNELEELRISTLSGTVNRAQAARLHQTLREQRDLVDDPELTALLDQIELRAEVELAKLDRAS
jgi:hypothetical protein